MIVLGIETATTVCSVAIASGERVVAVVETEQPNMHSERLLPMVDEALGRAGIVPSAVDAVAVSIGPGSFTGLRVGLSVAKGFVYAAHKELVAVPTLHALAERLNRTGTVKSGEYVLAALDARRDEVYCQLFRNDNGVMSPVWGVSDLVVRELFPKLQGLNVTITGNAQQKVAGAFSQDGSGALRFAGVEVARCSAETVVLIGGKLYEQGKREDPITLEPKYVKDFFLKVR